MARGRSGCGELLDFEEVSSRLQLGPRTDIGTVEIPVAEVIGSASRVHEFDGCFKPKTAHLRRTLEHIKATAPDAADHPILVFQVDRAYFVVDGHKRLSIAREEGRRFIDARVSWFPSRFRLTRDVTIELIRATDRERRFRESVGLDRAVPEARFPIADPDAYLELAESIKAHGYERSRELGRLIDPVEAAQHWYERVYRPAVDVAKGSGLARVLARCTEPELFLTLRHGADEAMGPGWTMPAPFVARALENLHRADPGPGRAVLRRVTGRQKPLPDVLPERRDGDDAEAREVGAIIARPRRELEGHPPD